MMMLIVLIFKFVLYRVCSGKVYVCYLFLIGLVFFKLVDIGSLIVEEILMDFILNN